MKNRFILFILLNIFLNCSKESENINLEINPIIGNWKLTNIKNANGEEISTPCEIKFDKFLIKDDNSFVWKSGLFYQNTYCSEYVAETKIWETKNDSLIVTSSVNNKTKFKIKLNGNILKTKLVILKSPNGQQIISDENLVSEYWYVKF